MRLTAISFGLALVTSYACVDSARAATNSGHGRHAATNSGHGHHAATNSGHGHHAATNDGNGHHAAHHATHPEWKRGYSIPPGSALGLPGGGLHYNGVAVGFFPGFGEAKSPNTPQDINSKLPAPMAVMGSYAVLKVGDTKMSYLDERLQNIKRLPGNPVWSLTLMPEKGLWELTPAVAQNIAKKMIEINQQGIPVWLRYGHEMNGDWYNWGQKPAEYIKAWKLLSGAVKSAVAAHNLPKKTYMLWSPNSYYGDSVDHVKGGWTPYWPGSQSVDIVGLSFYHYGGHDRSNIAPSDNEALKMMSQFDKLYGTGQGKPFVLSETSSAFTRLPGGRVAPGGASEYDMKSKWLQQIVGRDTVNKVPSLRAVVWFEIIKNENAAGNTPVKLEDFRLIMGDAGVSKFAHSFFSSGKKVRAA